MLGRPRRRGLLPLAGDNHRYALETSCGAGLAWTACALCPASCVCWRGEKARCCVDHCALTGGQGGRMKGGRKERQRAKSERERERQRESATLVDVCFACNKSLFASRHSRADRPPLSLSFSLPRALTLHHPFTLRGQAPATARTREASFSWTFTSPQTTPSSRQRCVPPPGGLKGVAPAAPAACRPALLTRARPLFPPAARSPLPHGSTTPTSTATAAFASTFSRHSGAPH